MKKIKINDVEYEVVKDVNDGIDKDVLAEKITDYFDDYTYIVGDWAYGKLRLKGFNKKGHPNYKDINDASKIEDYIKNYCAFDCRYFILEKESVLAINKK